MSKIALGTVQFGMDYGIASDSGKVDFKEVQKILGYANHQGVNLLDTAPAYGGSESMLGKANVQDFAIVTKTRHFHNLVISDHEIDLMKEDFKLSLSNLKRNKVYGVLIHNADDLLKTGADRLVEQLNNLKQAGKIEKIGVSVYSDEQLPFNILDRRLIDSGIISKLKKQNIEIHARSVFLQGLLLMDQQSRPSKFRQWDSLWRMWHDWLNDYDMTALEAAIRHAILTPEISKVLVGVDTQEQLKDIVNATKGTLPKVPKELSTNDINLLNPSNWSKL